MWRGRPLDGPALDSVHRAGRTVPRPGRVALQDVRAPRWAHRICKPKRVDAGHGVAPEREGVEPAVEPERIRADEPPGVRVVVPVSAVPEPRLLILVLPLEP